MQSRASLYCPLASVRVCTGSLARERVVNNKTCRRIAAIKVVQLFATVQVSPSREDREHKTKVMNPPLQHTEAQHRNKKIEKSNQREEQHKHHKTTTMTTTKQTS